jgi:hypothetical protein
MAGSRGSRVRVYFDGDTSGLDRATRSATGDIAKLTKAQEAQARALRAAGNSYTEIAKKIGVSDRAVRQFITDGERQSSTAGRLGRSSQTAAKHTSVLGGATSRLSGALKLAAFTAGSAVAAYVGISQVVGAISATEDLAKATLNLHKTFGLAIKSASEWAAVAASRGIDSKQLGMAFKALAAQFTAAGSASGKAAVNSKALASAQQGLKSSTEALKSAETGAVQAEQNLVRARKDAAQQIRQDQISAIDQLHSAQEGLTAANYAARQAEKSLRDARKAAAQAIIDEQNAAADAALGHQGAVLDLQQAQLNLAQVQKDPAATALDLAQAQLAVAEAQQRVKESQIEQSRAQKDSNKAQKQGVDQNPDVLSALHSQKEAAQAVRDAQHQLAQAQLAYNKAQKESIEQSSSVISAERGIARANEQVARAQEKVALAHKKVRDAQGAGNQSTNATVRMLHQLGFTHADIQKAMHNTEFAISKLAEGFGNLPPGVNKAAFAAKLFGRGWQTIFPIIRDGRKEMENQLKLADKYGATFSGKPLNSINDLIKAQRELKLAQIGMQIQFTEHVAPALIDAAKWFANLIRKTEHGKGALADTARLVGTVSDAIKVAVGWTRQAVQDVSAFFDRLGHNDEVKNTAQALKILAGVVKDSLIFAFKQWRSIVDTVVPHVMGVLQGISDWVRGWVEILAAVITGHWGRAWDGVKKVLKGAVEGIRNYLVGILALTRNLLGKVLDLWKGIAERVGKAALDLGKGAFDGVKNGVSGLASMVGGFVGAIPDTIKNLGDTVGTAAFNLGKKILSRMGDGISAVATAVTGTIKSTVKGVINAAIDIVNKFIKAWDKLSFHIPGVSILGQHIGDTTVGVPHVDPINPLARGAMVSEATLALLGEAGREYVIPVTGPNAQRGRELLPQAAADLGMQAFAAGGAVGRAHQRNHNRHAHHNGDPAGPGKHWFWVGTNQHGWWTKVPDVPDDPAAGGDTGGGDAGGTDTTPPEITPEQQALIDAQTAAAEAIQSLHDEQARNNARWWAVYNNEKDVIAMGIAAIANGHIGAGAGLKRQTPAAAGSFSRY